MTKYPKISIVIAVFNGVRFLEEAIVSIISQNYENTEIIIIDGGSNDGTVDVIKKYTKHIAYWESKPDKGQSYALNNGFKKATGEVLCWLNCDERYLPGALEKVANAFRNTPELDLFWGNKIRVDLETEKKYYGDYVGMHPKYWCFYLGEDLPSDTSFWSRKIHEKTGKIDEINFPKLSMDRDWFIRMSFHVKKWKFTKDYISIFLDWSGRMSIVHSFHYKPNISLKFARNRVMKEYNLGKLRVKLICILTTLYFNYLKGAFFSSLFNRNELTRLKHNIKAI